MGSKLYNKIASRINVANLVHRKYNEERKTFTEKVGAGRVKVEMLLGYPKLIKHTMEYIAAMKGTEI